MVRDGYGNLTFLRVWGKVVGGDCLHEGSDGKVAGGGADALFGLGFIVGFLGCKVDSGCGGAWGWLGWWREDDAVTAVADDWVPIVVEATFIWVMGEKVFEELGFGSGVLSFGAGFALAVG